jgi:hypothetical protein
MKAKITDRTINLEGFKYFVGGASSVAFGDFGDKRVPIGPGKLNYLDVWGCLTKDRLEEVALTVSGFDIEFENEKGIGLFAGLEIPGLGHLDSSLSIKDVSGGKVKLMKVTPRGDGELIRQYNASPRALNKLIDFGGSARVVETVLVAVEAELYDSFTAGLTSEGAVVVEGVLVKAELAGKWQAAKTVKVSKGTTLGYSLSEPIWNANQDRNKTAIERLRADQQGL